MSLPPSFFNHLEDRINIAVYDINQELRMNAIDRIKNKALQAKGIAPQAIRDFEADLDGILAEKDRLAQRRAAAVVPHKEAISGIFSEMDGLKEAMDLLSNGGPPLGDTASTLPKPSIVDKPRVDTGAVEHITLQNGEPIPPQNG